MAQNLQIANATYEDVPSISVPTQGGGTASFVDTSDANAAANEIDEGKTAYVGGVKVTGTRSGGGGGGGGYIIELGRITTTEQINSNRDAFYDCGFDSPMPDTNYSVFNSIVNNHSGSGSARLMVLDSDKTVNGFKMRIYASGGNVASGNEFDWMAIHL